MNSTAWAIIVVIAVLILLAIVGYQSAQNNSGTPTPTPVETPVVSEPLPQSYSVSYTNEGFVPASIKIRAGDTVNFINNSSSTMRVASDPHPTHTDYTGFDQMTGAANSGNYSFTFRSTGDWGYHNHAKANHTGNVLVQ